MKALLIPVKKFSNAKQRLAAHFSSAERAALAEALWRDFSDVVAKAHGIDHVFVVSGEDRVLDDARERAWTPIQESRQVSESDSVDFASHWCGDKGVSVLLRLPIDLPLIEPGDVESIFAAAPLAPGAVMVPSRDGDGTNALLRTPVVLFPSRFGPGSFAGHLAEARKAGARLEILRNSRVEMDVDEIEDLGALSEFAMRPCATLTWLESHGFAVLKRTPRAESRVSHG
jgi:2-phospho-L-lactate/phosphoenolpyruvate guanylyltransferase